MIDWIGCKLAKCPYGKEYGNCDTCENLIRKEDVVEQYDYFLRHRRYVKFVKGEYKGKVGIVYPDGEINPYAKDVHMSDGSVIWCPRYDTELKEITEEEYKEASDG